MADDNTEEAKKTETEPEISTDSPKSPAETNSPDTTSDGEALDSKDTSLDEEALESKPDGISEEEDSSKPEKKKGPINKIKSSINIYLIVLASILLMAGTIIAVAFMQSQSSSKNNGVKTQSLDQSTLQQLANNDATVGSSQYILNVVSNAVFAGQVLVKEGLEVAGNLNVEGTTALNNVSVAGTGQFGQATISNNLTVGGNGSIQGSVSIAKSLQVSNSGSFGGAVTAPQITTSNLQLNGNLVLQHHISVSGPIPNRAGGAALGSGGSVSLSGTDTAGSITINTGSIPVVGCFVTVTFSTPFDIIPHILITPVGSGAAGVGYYINRSTTNFSVCATNPAPGGSTFGFDYFVID
ncbi:MAG: hypothetical protein ACHQT9_04230 [Candidatus Saccharimonadales bacterium]